MMYWIVVPGRISSLQRTWVYVLLSELSSGVDLAVVCDAKACLGLVARRLWISSSFNSLINSQPRDQVPSACGWTCTTFPSTVDDFLPAAPGRSMARPV